MLTAERIARIDRVLAARLGSVVDRGRGHLRSAQRRRDDPDERGARAAGAARDRAGRAVLRDRAASRAARIAGSISHRWPTPRPPPRRCMRGVRRLRDRCPTRGPASIEDVDVATPIAVMFGNEHEGLSPAAIAACDGAIAVPMFGFTESLQPQRHRRARDEPDRGRRRAYIGAPGDLDPERRARLRARWFALGIRGVVGVLERHPWLSVSRRATSCVANQPQPRDYSACRPARYPTCRSATPWLCRSSRSRSPFGRAELWLTRVLKWLA